MQLSNQEPTACLRYSMLSGSHAALPSGLCIVQAFRLSHLLSMSGISPDSHTDLGTERSVVHSTSCCVRCSRLTNQEDKGLRLGYASTVHWAGTCKQGHSFLQLAADMVPDMRFVLGLLAGARSSFASSSNNTSACCFSRKQALQHSSAGCHTQLADEVPKPG